MTKLAAGVEIGMVDIAGSDDSLVAIQQTNQVADAPKTKGRKLVRAYDNMDTAGQSRKRSDGIESSGKSSGTIDLALILGVATFGSAKYTENVHTTQNLTGTYVSVYDWVAAHNYMVDWSHPEEAGKILTLCICAQIGVLVAVYWIPWYLIFLVGGNFGLLAMSPHMRAFAKVYGVEFMLYLHERIIAKWQQLRRHLASTPVTGKLSAKHLGSSGTIDAGISFASPTLLGQGHGEEEEEDDDDNEGEDDRSLGIRDGYTTPPLLSLASSSGSSSLSLMRRPQTVSVFENQRWWIGFGWIPRLGSNERAKWSDESGRQRFASVNDFMPAEGYEWADEGEGWEIDRRWALPVSTDKDGWVYSDNFWRRPASSASAVSSYTRRRKWVRCIRPAVRIDDLIASAAATAT
ncbi:hypothetical protein GGI12_001021 [Dipsacomyces acuminosporus]|nr:hypothetical protein GGI12_001021 [Dipsacomyces acuminosporus]